MAVPINYLRFCSLLLNRANLWIPDTCILYLFIRGYLVAASSTGNISKMEHISHNKIREAPVEQYIL